MVFHRNCDLLKALSATLGLLKHHEKQNMEEPSTDPNTNKSAPSLDENVQMVARHLNVKLHEQAKKFISESKNTNNYPCLNIPALVTLHFFSSLNS